MSAAVAVAPVVASVAVTVWAPAVAGAVMVPVNGSDIGAIGAAIGLPPSIVTDGAGVTVSVPPIVTVEFSVCAGIGVIVMVAEVNTGLTLARSAFRSALRAGVIGEPV